LPVIGAGSDAVHRQFGCPVPVVYASKRVETACTYPIASTTIGNKHNRWGIAGGALIATDGTHPMRAVIRVLANKKNYIWKKSDGSQIAFRPQDLHITHIIFYGLPAEYVNKNDVMHETKYRTMTDQEGVSLLRAAPAFKATCFPAVSGVIRTARTEDAKQYLLILRAMRRNSFCDFAAHHKFVEPCLA